MEQMIVPNLRAALFGTRSEAAMSTYLLRLSPHEVIRVVRAEIASTGGAPELYVKAYSDFLIEEDYDRAAYGLNDDIRHDLVTSEAVLNIEPRLEQNYWVLSIIVHKVLGPRIVGDENSSIGAIISLDEFEHRVVAADPGRVSVRLAVETPLAKTHFDAWWADIEARHAAVDIKTEFLVKSEQKSSPEAAVKPQRPDASAADGPSGDGWTYPVREVVAVFADADAWEAAVNDLEISGFDRAGISVLGSGKAIKERIGHLYERVAEAVDDERAPRSAFVSQDSRVEGEAAAISVPLFIAGLSGAFAVVAAGGTLAAAVAATILGSIGGAGLGGLLARTVARHHRHWVAEQLAMGGLVLWVSVPNAHAQARAFEVLRRHGGQNLHVHETVRAWGPEQRALSQTQVDPLLLERDTAA